MFVNFHVLTFFMTNEKQTSKLFYHKSCFSTENHLLPTEVRKEALQLQKLLEYDDGGAEG